MKGHYGDAPAVSAEGGGGSERSNSFTPLQNKNKDLLRSHFSIKICKINSSLFGLNDGY